MAATKSGSDTEGKLDNTDSPGPSTVSTVAVIGDSSIKHKRRFEKAKVLKSRVKRLEKKLELYDRKIKRIMESEVTLEEMNSDTSAYLQEDILKRQFLKTWVELCDLLHISPEVQVGDSDCMYEGTKYSSLNRRVQRLIKHGEFPDYWDVCQLIQRVNTKHSLNITDKERQSLSQKVFIEVGEQLKKHRLRRWNALFGCHLTDDLEEDPAVSDESLFDTLASSVAEGKKKLDQVYDQFACIQEEEGDETDSSTNEEEDDEQDGALEGLANGNHPPTTDLSPTTSLPEPDNEMDTIDSGNKQHSVQDDATILTKDTEDISDTIHTNIDSDSDIDIISTENIAATPERTSTIVQKLSDDDDNSHDDGDDDHDVIVISD